MDFYLISHLFYFEIMTCIRKVLPIPVIFRKKFTLIYLEIIIIIKLTKSTSFKASISPSNSCTGLYLYSAAKVIPSGVGKSNTTLGKSSKKLKI